MNWMARLLLPLFGVGLIACASSGSSAPIVDRYNPSERAPDTYIVNRGDTLFSIAWRYGFDVKGLAAANNIRAPYTIYPGQTLALREARPSAYVMPNTPNKSAASSPTTPTLPKPASPKAATPKPTVSAPSVSTPSPNAAAPAGGWQWPVEGRVVRGFVATGQAHKGIDIGGKIGEPVRAAQPGVVVYSGSGLVGYGNLLILKHSERHLSAYGHNRKLLVKEGEQIKTGQVIAELGDSGTDTAKLHFEVRIDGKPVDPLRLLPRRN